MAHIVPTRILAVFAFLLGTFYLTRADAPVSIGRMTPFAHGVKSGTVKVVDDKTLLIQNFYYNGDGPDAWFVVGKDGDYTSERPKQNPLPFEAILPDERGSCEKPGSYRNQTIQLTLPGHIKINDIRYFMVYCIRYNHNFGYVTIPSGLRVDPSSQDEGPTACNSSPILGGSTYAYMFLGASLILLNAVIIFV